VHPDVGTQLISVAKEIIMGDRPDILYARSLILFTLVVFALLADSARAQHKPKIELVPNIPHNHHVNAVAFSPDGIRVLSGSADRTLKLWDTATGQLLRTFEGHLEPISSVAFSPDGARVLSGSWDKTLKLWDAATGQLLHTFEGHSQKVTSVAFSPDGDLLVSGSNDNTVKLWNVATGNVLRTFEGHSMQVKSVAFSSKGDRVLSGSEDKTVKLWDPATGQLLHTFEAQSASINAVAFSPDGGRVLAGGDEATLLLWDSRNGQLLRTFERFTADYFFTSITSVAFSPDGSLVLTGSWDGTLKILNTTTGQLVRGLGVHSEHADGMLYFVNSVSFSPDGGQLLSGGNDTQVKLWDRATGQLLRTFGGESSTVSSVAFSPDGTWLLSGGDDGTLKLWEVANGRLLRTHEGHSDSVNSVAFSQDGTHLLSGSSDSTVRLWDASTGRLIRTQEGHSAQVRSVAFSPDGSYIISGANSVRTIKLWRTVTGELVRDFTDSDVDGDAVVFSPDGSHVLSGSWNNKAKLWNVATGEVLLTFEGHSETVGAVAYSSDGKRVLTGSRDKSVKLWDATTGQQLRNFEGHSGEVTSVAFSPDGIRVLSGAVDHTLNLWDGNTGRLLRTFDGHVAPVSSVAFSPDGTRIASGGYDTTIRIWDTQTGHLLVSMLGAADGGWLAITPAGFFDASSSGLQMLAVVRGLETTTIAQVHQSLFSPDLVREALADDPNGEVKRAAEFINLDKVLDSGPAPLVEITSTPSGGKSETYLVTVAARIKDRGKGIGRIEWRVNGITTGVANAPVGSGPDYEVEQTLALDPGQNTIEVVAYNARNLLASLPAQTTVTYDAPVDAEKPKLYVLAIGINAYHDEGWTPPGATKREYFPALTLAVDDARSIGEAFKEAGSGFYEQVIVRTAFDEEATAAGLERIVQDISAEINPRDTFVLFAAAHGYSNNGRFYLLPQDYQGGPDPAALSSRAIGQERLQDWIANRIKAKRAIILLDTCESGALTNGYAHSRIDGPASEAAVGRLHEATGRPVLTAAAAGENAHEGYRGHGFFTWALIDALFHGDTNGDGLIELSELAAHVQNMVPKISPGMKGRGIAEILMQHLIKEDRQTAHFGSTGGDFALVRRLQ
jgi:WD40 repeat protein